MVHLQCFFCDERIVMEDDIFYQEVMNCPVSAMSTTRTEAQWSAYSIPGKILTLWAGNRVVTINFKTNSISSEIRLNLQSSNIHSRLSKITGYTRKSVS